MMDFLKSRTFVIVLIVFGMLAASVFLVSVLFKTTSSSLVDGTKDDSQTETDPVFDATTNQTSYTQEKHLPIGVSEPYCDCLADRLRPPVEYQPTRFSKTIWSTRDVPTDEEIQSFLKSSYTFQDYNKETNEGFQKLTSKERLLRSIYLTALDRSKPKWEYDKNKNIKSLNDYFQNVVRVSNGETRFVRDENAFKRMHVEFLGWDYYKGPIPFSSIEEAYLEYTALKRIYGYFGDFEDGFHLDYNPEYELLYDKISLKVDLEVDLPRFFTLSHDLNLFNISVILLDYHLNQDGHLEQFTFRFPGFRAGYKVTIDHPIESFIANDYWAGNFLLKSVKPDVTVRMLPLNESNKTLLDALIQYGQVFNLTNNISIYQNVVKKDTAEKIIESRDKNKILRELNPSDNTQVIRTFMPIFYPKPTDENKQIKPKDEWPLPNDWTLNYYGGDFVFKINSSLISDAEPWEMEILTVQFNSHIYPDDLDVWNDLWNKVKNYFRFDQEYATNEVAQMRADFAWTAWRQMNSEYFGYTYRYSARDRLTLIAPPFRGFKAYDKKIDLDKEFIFVGSDAWKTNPKGFYYNEYAIDIFRLFDYPLFYR